MRLDQIIHIGLIAALIFQLISTAVLFILRRDKIYINYLIYLACVSLYVVIQSLTNLFPVFFPYKDLIDGLMKLVMGLTYFNFVNRMIFQKGMVSDFMYRLLNLLFKITLFATIISSVLVWFGLSFSLEISLSFLMLLGLVCFYNLIWVICRPQPIQVYFIAAGALILVFAFLLTMILIYTIPAYQANPNQLYYSITTLATIVEIILFMIGLQFYYHSNLKTTHQYQKEIITMELEALRTQDEILRSKLNPHFVQNIFSILSLHLPPGNTYESFRMYISQASVYFRKFLTTTSKVLHSLESELEYLEEYIKMQQLIVKNKFEYTVIVEPTVDTYSIKVPTMWLQPIIENSIKHGLSHLDYPGELNIRVWQEESNLMIQVDDNGRGANLTETYPSSLGHALTKSRSLSMQGFGLTSTIRYFNNPTGKGFCTKITISLL